jgi:hypothetical protein
MEETKTMAIKEKTKNRMDSLMPKMTYDDFINSLLDLYEGQKNGKPKR